MTPTDFRSLTLPDYLLPGLKLIFVGLNPGLYSAQQGMYFARATNRFWPALSASSFFGREVRPGDERQLSEEGIGFTDVVKRASGQIDELSRTEIVAGAKILRRKLVRARPQAACFVGITGYRWMFDLPARTKIVIGPQAEKSARRSSMSCLPPVRLTRISLSMKSPPPLAISKAGSMNTAFSLDETKPSASEK